MKRNPKAILFDWDGTLAETRSAVVESMEYVLKHYGKEPWDITKTKYRDTNKSLKENFFNFFGAQADEAYKLYLKHYKEHGYNQVKPIPQADQFIELCQKKNIDLYIVSNKERQLLLKEISQCFPNAKFKKILANGDAPHNKPSPDPVYVALKDNNFPVNRENVYFVGDSKQDTDCAMNASVYPVLLGKGNFMDNAYIKKESSNNSLLHINSFDDLATFIKG